MKNSIIENFYQQLLNLYAKEPSASEKAIIKEAATKLLGCATLLDLAQFLASYETNPLQSDKFFKYIEDWKSMVDKMTQLTITVNNRLTTVLQTNENKDLLSFIQRILDSRFSLLHLRMFGLLYYLNAPHLEKTLSNLTSLPTASWPQIINQGDYLALKPKDEIHGACLVLLNNNSQARSNENPEWDLANSILQSTLQIYEDTHDISEQDKVVNFDVSADFAEEEEPYSSCICM